MMRDTCDLNWVEERYKVSELATPVIAARPTRRVLEIELEMKGGYMGTKIYLFLNS